MVIVAGLLCVLRARTAPVQVHAEADHAQRDEVVVDPPPRREAPKRAGGVQRGDALARGARQHRRRGFGERRERPLVRAKLHSRQRRDGEAPHEDGADFWPPRGGATQRVVRQAEARGPERAEAVQEERERGAVDDVEGDEDLAGVPRAPRGSTHRARQRGGGHRRRREQREVIAEGAPLVVGEIVPAPRDPPFREPRKAPVAVRLAHRRVAPSAEQHRALRRGESVADGLGHAGVPSHGHRHTLEQPRRERGDDERP
mmetsp:Transcript_8714/g.35285  ORF Transcript_8714/g.35285 Transcript_8714/m.35285 type:complete len:258 (-) Transcript_8714:65-838(-)